VHQVCQMQTLQTWCTIDSACHLLLGVGLIVSSVGYRQPKTSKPVGTAKVVQEVGQFGPKVLENWILRDVCTVFIGRIGGPNRFAQGGEAIEFAMINTTMQRMSHLLRRLCPSPDIALERIGQTALGLPPSRPVEAPGSNQHGAVPLTPSGSCKHQSLVRKLPCAYLAYDNKTLCQMNTCICCIIVCNKSA
jgi:hypothetical protein